MTMINRDHLAGLIPEETTKEIIQGAIAKSAALSMFKKLPNMSSKVTSVNVLDMLPVAYWVDGDNGRKGVTKQAWDKKKIVAEEIAVIVPIPEAVLDDSNYDIWGEVKPRLEEAFGAAIDAATFFGVDKPKSWRDSIYDTAKAAGSIVTATSDTYEDIMGESGVIAKVEASGFIPDAHVASVKMRAKLRGLKGEDGHPIFKSDMQGATPYALDGGAMQFPQNGSWDDTKALMITGNFNQAVYSIRQDITFKIFDSGVVQDPATGEILYNLMQNDMVALRAVMRLGWEIPNPVNRLQSDKTKRCPFAIYAPAAG